MTNKITLVLIDIAHRENAINLCREAKKQLDDNGELHVAYVMPYGNYSYIEPYISKDSIKAASERAHKSLDEIIEEAALSSSIPHVLRGSIGEQILLLAKKINATLLMLNAHRPGVEIHCLGSNAAQIVRHATCSVFVYRKI